MNFYHDKDRKLLVYQPDKPELVCLHIPEAKRLNGKLVAFPATLRNVQVMRWLDYPIPNLLEADGYDWPIQKGYKPLEHQKMMAAFMASHPRCFNLSDMGTMKTLASLWAADYVMQQYPKGTCRAVIVAPLSILERVWATTIFSNFLGRRNYRIVYGDAKKRARELAEPADFYIINFDGVGLGAQTRGRFQLDGISKSLAERNDIQITIIDEASAYRDHTTRRSRLAKFILAPKSYVWMLTGTPTPNGPTDAFGLARIINNAYGESWTSYHNRTMARWGQWVWRPRPGANVAARKLLTPAVRVDIKDVWNGPAITVQQRVIPLTAEQTTAIRELKREAEITLKTGPITVANEAAARLKLIQICLGGVYDSAHKSHAVDATPRLTELRQVLEETGRKVAIFIPLTNIIHLVQGQLTKWGYGNGVINSEVTLRERSALLVRFRDDDRLRVLLCDPATSSHGINEMVAADTCIWFGPTDRTELYLQGVKRLHRPGQTWPVTNLQFVSTAVEMEIFRRLEHNESQQGLLLGMVKNGTF
jgi:SNF2 family DNA or RNA helicase